MKNEKKSLTIAEIHAKKHAAENEISEVINLILNRLSEETNLSISDIEIEIIDVSTHEKKATLFNPVIKLDYEP